MRNAKKKVETGEFTRIREEKEEGDLKMAEESKLRGRGVHLLPRRLDIHGHPIAPTPPL